VTRDGISLTDSGRGIANRLLVRHYLIERMLAEIFGMEWYRVHDEAEQMEHAVSSDFERLLRDKLGETRPCPHGNLVNLETHSERRARGLVPLMEAPPGSGCAVEAVFERDRQLTALLAAYAATAAMLVALTSGNVGTLVRHRGLAVPYLVWFSALGACKIVAFATAYRQERHANHR